MKHFEEVIYYSSVDRDEHGEYGCGDYRHIELIDKESEEVVQRFGDHYHDKGYEKLEGFYRGLEYAGVKFSVECKVAKVE